MDRTTYKTKWKCTKPQKSGVGEGGVKFAKAWREISENIWENPNTERKREADTYTEKVRELKNPGLCSLPREIPNANELREVDDDN